MICPGCGLEMNDRKYCMNCGRPLDNVPPRPTGNFGPAGPSNPVPQQNVAPQNNPSQNAAPQNNPQQNAAPQNNPSQNAAPQNIPPQNTPLQNPSQPGPNTSGQYYNPAAQNTNVNNPPQNPGQQMPVNNNPSIDAYNRPPVPPVQKKRSGGGLAFAIVMIVLVLAAGGVFLVYKVLNGFTTTISDVSNGVNNRDEDVVPEATAKQTIMIYMIGSNLESEGGLATRDLKEIKRSAVTEDTNIILQTGGCKDWSSLNSYCKDKKVQRFELIDGQFEEIDNLGKVSMVDSDTLYDFIKFTAKKYPAEDYVLILWDHGGGIPVGYGIDENYPDEIMYVYELADAIKKSGVHFDSIVFDACNMCTLETCMALKDSSDYLIGAESYVNGTGISYTNWINSLADSPVANGDYRELIVSDYMDYCQRRGMVASMSVISLSHIGAVYDAYVDYICMLKEDLEDNCFSDISTARNDCGIYEYTDCVDLVTLAGKYENSASTSLINTVVSAVDYTESDFAFGHGVMAYFPFNELLSYDVGRTIFEELDYNEDVSKFYDELISLKFAFEYGVADARSHSGDWFDEDIIDLYDNHGVAVAEAQEIYLPSYSAEYEDGLEHYYMKTSEIEWMESLCLLMIEGDDGNLIFLGQDVVSEFDDDGDLVAENPENWTYLADRLACFVSVDYYYDEETDEWNQSGMIPVKVNGEMGYIYVFYSQDYPEGTIYGYMSDDENDNYLYDLEDTDEIQILWYDPTNDVYVEAYDPFMASEISLEFKEIDLSCDTTYVIYQITDVYGNIYTSDAFVYENNVFVDVVSMEE